MLKGVVPAGSRCQFHRFSTEVLSVIFTATEDRLSMGSHLKVAGFSAVPRCRHALVVGGSLAGMLAAGVQSHHFDGVTLLGRPRSRCWSSGTPERNQAQGRPFDHRWPGVWRLLAAAR
jgi:hypothetical protein